MMHRLQRPQPVFYTLTLIMTAFLSAGRHAYADIVFLEKAPDSVFTTGAEFNAIAGGLLLGSFDIEFATPAGLPDGGTLSASSVSGATATNMFTLEPDFASGPAFFDSGFTGFSRSGVLDQRATAEGHIEFKVDTPAMYTIDGFFDVDDVGTSVGNVELEVHLFDITAGASSPVPIFSSYQKSISTNDQMFMVGGTDGDDVNSILGTPDGLLDPSKHYAFKYLVNTLAIGTTTDAATASGMLTFVVTGVPEPSGLVLVGLGLSTSLLRRRRLSAQ